MANDLIYLEKDGNIGTVVLNRPEKLNAMAPPMLLLFDKVMQEARDDDDIKVVVIRGNGRAFSTGYDMEGGGVEQTIAEDRDYQQVKVERWQRIRDFPKPVIAMIHGYCIAGASQMAIHCDVIFVAEDTQLGFPVVPAGGGMMGQSWAWHVGPHKAKWLSFLPGSMISGKEAEAMNFASKAFPADKLEEETYSYARRIAKVPGDLLRIKKLAINRVMDVQGFQTSIKFGAEWNAIAHRTSGTEEVRGEIKKRGLRGAIEWWKE